MGEGEWHSGPGDEEESSFAEDMIFGSVGLSFRVTLTGWKNGLAETT